MARRAVDNWAVGNRCVHNLSRNGLGPLGHGQAGGVNVVSAAILVVFVTAGSAVTGQAAPPVAPPPGPLVPAAVSVSSPYRPPVAALRVLTPFTPPADRYGAGHLGVDVTASEGAPVLAAGGGLVRFAGPVAGRGVVVLVHPDGISTEYEPLAAVVVAGQRVAAGQRIGTVRGVHRGCPVGCLHWGARRGTSSPPQYLDPLPLLGPLGVVRLLPWN